MFNCRAMGIVIEKEPQVVCVYATDSNYQKILCATPLCAPKNLKGLEYKLSFDPCGLAKLEVGDIRIIVDFENHTCCNNKNITCYGSDAWGQSVSVEWDSEKDKLF